MAPMTIAHIRKAHAKAVIVEQNARRTATYARELERMLGTPLGLQRPKFPKAIKDKKKAKALTSPKAMKKKKTKKTLKPAPMAAMAPLTM